MPAALRTLHRRPLLAAAARAAGSALLLAAATLASAAPEPSSAPVATVARQTVDTVYAADAMVEAVRQATVSAQIAGTVVALLVDAGDPVRKGQLLARLDTRDTDAQVAAGRANVAQADAQAAQARLNYTRTQSLLQQRFVSQAALDKAEADWKAAQAAADAARAGAQQAGTARSFAELRAPIDGVVTRRLLEVGELATPGRGVLALHDPSALRAVGNLPQHVLARAAGATRAQVVLPAVGRTVEATRVTVLPAADARLLSTQVRADLPAVPGLAPGASAKVLVPIGRASKLLVPASAVLQRGEVTAVRVVTADGATQLRQVRLGEPAGDGAIEVLAGLTDGERVLLAPLAAGNAAP